MHDASSLYGTDLFGASAAPKPVGPVAERFLFPPFSVLDARAGNWQERKRAWKALGMRSEVGRSAAPGGAMLASYADGVRQVGLVTDDDTSVFDPVLCELVYRWFACAGRQVLDPFAGGSVRGIIAAQLGLHYWGCDLRPEQIEANRAQAEEICTGGKPRWICGDSLEACEMAPLADLVFSCPPYGDLEVYSDDPADLSTLPWPEFCSKYRAIIAAALARLKPDRFACFVVGDFRCSKGFYRNFVSETIAAFEAAGARLYNEAVLLTALGSSAMRLEKTFEASRKMVKVHQNVLVFCKGDPKRAAAACRGLEA
jgi:hypothetical protein